MKRILVLALVTAAIAAVPEALARPLKVVATTSDLAAIAIEFAGPLAEVTCLVPAGAEPHSVSHHRPWWIARVRESRLLFSVGPGHEPWLEWVIAAAGNSRALPGAPGFVDCSRGIQLLDVPERRDPTRGPAMASGNTHYWLDPSNLRVIAVHVLHALVQELPERERELRGRTADFLGRLDARLADWRARLAPLRGTRVVTYHDTFPYLARFAGLVVAGTIEPNPGIEPGPRDLAALEARMRAAPVGLVLVEPWFDGRRAAVLARRTGAQVLVIAPSARKDESIVVHFENIVRALEHGASVI